MNFKILIISFVSAILFSTSSIPVDVGSLYYLELDHKGITYYTRYGTYGMINEDLNFYNTSDSTQKTSLNDLRMREMITKGQLNIYKEINIVELNKPIDGLPNKLFSISYGTEISADSFRVDDIYFTRLIGEGTPGEFYSEQLMKDTDDWYNRIEIHELFISMMVRCVLTNFMVTKTFMEMMN